MPYENDLNLLTFRHLKHVLVVIYVRLLIKHKHTHTSSHKGTPTDAHTYVFRAQLKRHMAALNTRLLMHIRISPGHNRSDTWQLSIHAY
jgi:hypothetical protein